MCLTYVSIEIVHISPEMTNGTIPGLIVGDNRNDSSATKVDFTISITKIQEISADNSVIQEYIFESSNITAEESIHLNINFI